MEANKTTLATLSHSPGVYIYKNADHRILYVGKAVDLQKRIRQYFERDDAVGFKTTKLVSEIASIDTIQTQSEFEALLLESKLIKEYQPKYNVVAKDDKSPLYVAISFEEELPRVFFTRKPKDEKNDVRYFGPFQSSRAARNLLRSLRRVVPYCTQKQRNGRRCFYTHLHLCDPCPSYIAKLPAGEEKKKLTKEYRQHLFRLRDILSGKAVAVVKELEDEMNLLAADNKFEEAASVRNQLLALRSLLERRYDPSVYVQSDTLLNELVEKERQELLAALQPYYPQLTKLHRIECFDISNTMGTYATASMVVMTDGSIDKSQYRKFRMRTKDTPNDFAMMAELIKRRFSHPEWEFPNLVVIDGGKGQVNSAKHALLKSSLIPLIGLAKRQEEIIVPCQDDWKVIRLPFSSGGLKLLQRLRDEAHRFAITYHKLLREKHTLII